MKKTLLAVAVAFFLASPVHAAPSNKEGIAVVVNSEAITNSDVEDRIKMIGASTGIAKNPELMEKLRPQIIEMLIDEALKMQEAKRLNVKVTKTEIDAGFAEIAKNNNIPVEQFREMIDRSGLRISTINEQIESQIAWGKVIAARVRPKIDVTDADIDAELEKLRGKIGQTQYSVSQIYLPMNATAKEADVKNFAVKLAGQLREQPEAFGKAAQQFSQAPGAKQGGAMGWIEKGQLPEEIDAVLDSLEPGAITDPIKSQNAYYILTLKEKREMTEELLPKREDILQRIGGQRLERAARRYMLDLRSSAFIETRA